MAAASLIVPKSAVLLPPLASDEEILSLVKCWAEALAREDFEGAYDMTAHDPYYEWTPGLIRKVIEGYGSPEPHSCGPHKVTSLVEVKTSASLTPRHEVDRFDSPNPDGAIGEVWFDLPLDGEWSDLTATFGLQPLGGRLVLVLNQIHVF